MDMLSSAAVSASGAGPAREGHMCILQRQGPSQAWAMVPQAGLSVPRESLDSGKCAFTPKTDRIQPGKRLADVYTEILFKKNPHLRICLLILKIGRGREGDRERETCCLPNASLMGSKPTSWCVS